MRPLRIEFPGAVYHVMSRGNERKVVFRDDADRLAFLAILHRTVERWRWSVHAYCLMSNHYHLLVETSEPNLSRGMRQLNGEYSQGFNRRHRRAGHLLQGRFQAVLVEKQTHLLELCRYVVLNPVRAKMVKVAGQWSWSSYGATAGKAGATPFLTTSWVLAQFSRSRAAAQRAYEHFVAEGAVLGRRGAPKVRHGLWIGGKNFLEEIRKDLEARAGATEFRLTERMAHRPSLEEMISPEEMEDRGRLVLAVGRAYLEARYTQRQIAQHLGVHYMTVSRLLRAHERELG